MTDPRELAMRPRADFAERLEHALLDELSRSTTTGFERHSPPTTRMEIDMTTLELEPDTDEKGARRWWLAAAAGIVLVGGFVVASSARDDSTSSSDASADGTELTFETEWPSLTNSQRCFDTAVVYEWAENRRCIRTFEGETTLTGDIAGTALWMMLANEGTAADPEDAKADITATFNGTYLVRAEVAGCGSGEFVIAEQLQFLGWESGQFAGTWQIIPGSGRGDLASISGSGTMPAADTDVVRAHTGTVSCG